MRLSRLVNKSKLSGLGFVQIRIILHLSIQYKKVVFTLNNIDIYFFPIVKLKINCCVYIHVVTTLNLKKSIVLNVLKGI